MARQLTVMVFFNTDQLGDRRFQLSARGELLKAGIERLQREAPYVKVLEPNQTSCAVPVQVDEHRLGDLVAHLEAHRDWASYEIDEPGILRAARW